MKNARALALLFAVVLCVLPAAAQKRDRARRAKPRTPESRTQDSKPVLPATKTSADVDTRQAQTTNEVEESPANETAAPTTNEPEPVVEPLPPITTAPPIAAPSGGFPLGVVAVIALLTTLAVFGFIWRMRKLERKLLATAHRIEREQIDRDKRLGNQVITSAGELRADVESLRAAVAKIPAETERLIAPALRARQESIVSPRLSPPVVERYEEARVEDPVAQLLTIANRIVQDSSITLESCRAKTTMLSARVSAFPNAAEGTPVAFIVEHLGSCYAIPNVVKPTRLPQDWFNRSEFGINDEIRRVVSLPRLKRRGNAFDVQEAGVFER